VLGGVVIVLITIAGAKLILSAQPSARTTNAAFIRTGAVGQTLDALDFSVEVTGVRGAHVLALGDGSPVQTGGIFILVRTRITAYRKPIGVDLVEVLDAKGNTYKATEKLDQGPINTYQPGSPTVVEFVFEVPTAAATTLTARFAEANTSDYQDKTYADFTLGITAEEVAQWTADTVPVSPQRLRLES
jgi:hypothetical protein